MSEAGVDLSAHTSKSVAGLVDQSWDYVITVCDSDNEQCPIFPRRTRRLHWSFPDPSQATGTEDEQLQVFRRVRDAVAGQITQWVAHGVTLRLAQP